MPSPPHDRPTWSTIDSRPRAEVVVDLGAIRHNLGRLRERVGGESGAPALMMVVKADAYGHGLLPVSRTARAAGVPWLGVATPDEALALRADGDTGRLLCWLAAPGQDYAPLVAADVDVTVYGVDQLRAIEWAAGDGVARVQLKLDTGLSRGGAPRAEWAALIAEAVDAEQRGHVKVTGLWSHFACSDEPDRPENAAQEQAFREALALADETGLRPEVRHLANSAGALFHPTARFDLVRVGIAAYGLTPAPQVASSADLGLVPAMTVRATLALTKQIDAGSGVSYGHQFIADRPMRVGLVPLGYGDGIPRQASGRGQVQVAGERASVLGRVCMDQLVVGTPSGSAGDDVVVFGTGADGEPTAQDWAEWSDTISYEIVTRIGGRAVRRWKGLS